MKSSASAGGSATEMESLHEGVVALVRWRLGDPSWKPSFADLLDDARACIDPSIEAAGLLGALKAVVIADRALAPAAGRLAVEARRTIAERVAVPGKRPGPSGGFLARWRARRAGGQERSGTATSRTRN
jgi:hypothetical protein